LKSHIRHILFYYFKKEKKATEARKKLRRVYGRNVAKKCQCQNWFAGFRDGDFSVKDAHRSGRPFKIDDDEMKALVQANSTVRELATALKVSVGSVHGHLKSLGFVKKLDVWVPHELKEIHLMNCVCDQFIKREENDPFLKRMITATKNGLFTTISAEKEVGVSEVKHRKGKQRQRSTKR